MPATGWMPVGEKFRTIAQGVSKQVFKLVVKIRLRINLRVSKFSARSIVMHVMPCMQKQAKSCKMCGIVLHIPIPGLASMT